MSGWIQKLSRLAVLLGLCVQTAAAAPMTAPGREVPPGFTLILSDAGTELYSKEYPGGQPDYVQVADLGGGAAVQLLHGPIVDPGAGSGAYGGANPTFARQALADVWANLSAARPGAFCVANAGFFSTGADPTPLAFPLKVNGVLVSDGYGLDEFPNQKTMLELWPDRADIVALTRESLTASSAPNILAGLADDADKDPNKPTGRTFAGVADRDRDGDYETVLVFSSALATQPGAADILRGFGAEKVIMLDGGGSTQLICKGTAYVVSSDGRRVPQTLAVLSRSATPLDFAVVSQPKYPVLVQGESYRVEIELRNTGALTWLSGDVGLVNGRNPWGAEPILSLPQDVPPGAAVTFGWQTEPFTRSGVHTSEWYLAQRGEQFGEPLSISLVVLPPQLAGRKQELEQQVQQWAEEQLDDLQALITAWIEQQVDQAAESLQQAITNWIETHVIGSIENAIDKACSSVSLAPAAALMWVLHRRRRRRPRAEPHAADGGPIDGERKPEGGD